MQLSPRHETIFVSLYKRYGRSWDWNAYASAVSDRTGLHGDTRITGPEIRAFVERNRKRLQEAGLSFPQLPKRLDKDRLAALYAEHGKSWTWAKYAAKLSEEQGFSGEDAFGATAISVYFSRHRAELNIPPRHIGADDALPWPRINLTAYKQTHYWRFLLLYLRVQRYGESSLVSSPTQHKRYLATRNRLWRDKEVIRYDPAVGFHPEPAHEDELDPPRIVELQHHYFARHPTERQAKAKDI